MKKAFTLIELLVVIAIIAILAAILFPVFAQAKLAAKKTTSLSNQKQNGLGIILYTADYDDTYPRNDDCILNSSLLPQFNVQPAGTDPTPWCNGAANPGAFAFRVNHYAWQKWIVPYTKNTQLFFHPVLPLITGTSTSGGVWNGVNQGEIANGYSLNIAITGSLNTWNCAGAPNCTNAGAYRNSWIGGTQTAVPDTASAFLLTEQGFFDVTGAWNVGATVDTSYPPAFREHWKAVLQAPGGTDDCGTVAGSYPQSKVPFNVIPMGFVDGHAKAMAPGQFLAQTPTYAQYTGAPLDTNVCNYFASYFKASLTGPSPTAGTWPLWGIQ